MKIFIFFTALLLFFPALVLADADSSAPNPASANYSKAEKLLPGEEVVTPTGQRLKVWSTQGPVEVSKAPEPFDDEQEVDEDIHVVVDGVQVLKQNQSSSSVPSTPRREDSFDVQ